MPIPNFFAVKGFTYPGGDEIQGFSVQEHHRLPADCQSYPKVRLLPADLQKLVFDANSPKNDITIPEDPIIEVTAWDAFQEDPVTAKRAAREKKRGAPVPPPPVAPPDAQAAPVVEPDKPDSDPFSNDLPPQAVQALLEAGITHLTEAQAMSDEDLLSLKGFGPGSLVRLRGLKA